MKEIAFVILAIALLIVPASAGWFTKDAPPISLEDTRTIVAALRPISKGNTTDVAVYVWADGSINIAVRLPNGTDVRGHGLTLKGALTDLVNSFSENAQQSVNANEALKSILNDGKPSQ